jgi:hypothetical protein
MPRYADLWRGEGLRILLWIFITLYINKRDIILAQISACELLYKYTTDSFDKNILKKEISDLKLMLDLIE